MLRLESRTKTTSTFTFTFFQGMSVIIYMGAVLGMLYYLGVTQVCAAKMAWLMQRTMGTTAIETLGVSSNIFLNGVSHYIPLFFAMGPFNQPLTRDEAN